MERMNYNADLFTEYILARIASGEYAEGTKLPSIRRLAMKFGLSYSAAWRRTAELIRSGYLRSSHGSGLYVANTDLTCYPETGRTLLALVSREPDRSSATSISYAALLAFRQYAALAGFRLDIRAANYRDGARVIRAAAAGCSGVALFHEYDAVLETFPDGIPAVAVLMDRSYGGRLSLVNIDADTAAEQAVAFFRERGAGSVAVYSSPLPLFRTRAECFLTRWRETGGDATVSFGLPDLGSFPARRQACFFTSDSWLHYFVTDYREATGREFERDYLILGVDGKRRLNPDWPPFPTIAADWNEIGRLMFEELRRLIHNPDAARRRIGVAGRLQLATE